MSNDCWDRAAQQYADFWVPRLIPYHHDLVRKCAPRPRERVLVTSVGPGAELLPLSRALQNQGVLAATDPSEAMIVHARDTVVASEIALPVELRVADANDTLGQRWDLIINAFSFWQLPNRLDTLRAWRNALTYGGRLALLVWGPPDPSGPFEQAGAALREAEPDVAHETHLLDYAARQPMAEMLSHAGLRLVLHAVVRHPMEFPSAEGFFRAMCNGGSFLHVCKLLGTERMRKVETCFYSRLTPPSPRTPLAFAPAATIAIAEAS